VYARVHEAGVHGAGVFVVADATRLTTEGVETAVFSRTIRNALARVVDTRLGISTCTACPLATVWAALLASTIGHARAIHALPYLACIALFTVATGSVATIRAAFFARTIRLTRLKALPLRTPVRAFFNHCHTLIAATVGPVDIAVGATDLGRIGRTAIVANANFVSDAAVALTAANCPRTIGRACAFRTEIARRALLFAALPATPVGPALHALASRLTASTIRQTEGVVDRPFVGKANSAIPPTTVVPALLVNTVRLADAFTLFAQFLGVVTLPTTATAAVVATLLPIAQRHAALLLEAHVILCTASAPALLV